MNHLLIITTCFQNTLGSFLHRHLAIIKSLRKQKLDLAPNTLPSVASHPEHMERKWHHSVTWSQSSGTPKQAFYSTPFTHRETSRLRRFSTLLWGLLQNFEDSPHRDGLFLMVPPRSAVNLDMFMKHASGSIGTNPCVIKKTSSKIGEFVFVDDFISSSYLGLCYSFVISFFSE